MVNVKTLQSCLNEKIESNMGNFVDTVADRVQNAILTTMDSIITHKIKLAFRSVNASFERDATSVMASSKRGENVGITAPFENVSEKNSALPVLNTND